MGDALALASVPPFGPVCFSTLTALPPRGRRTVAGATKLPGFLNAHGFTSAGTTNGRRGNQVADFSNIEE